jgi:hypothetical protein
MSQLSLFEQIGCEYFRTGAYKLLDALNLGLKTKDFYRIEYYYQHQKLFVLIACNREKHIVCNVVDENGNIPKDFCVNWRIHQEVMRELKIELV